jgi:hypothetical protein
VGAKRVGVPVGANGNERLINGWTPLFTHTSQKYTLVSRARAVPKQCIFFYLIIGLKGYNITLGLRTHMTISFEHLERVLGIYD